MVEKTEIYINAKEELKKYDLAGKWNDYIAVQKEVLRVLRTEDFFNNNVITNTETGMQITISPKDIRETLGKDMRFQSLPKELKEYKIITIRQIKDLILTAILYEDNVANIHENGTDTFAYFRNYIFVDNKEITVRITVKKKVASNHFHIHHINTNEKSLELLRPSHGTEVLETQDSIIKLTENS